MAQHYQAVRGMNDCLPTETPVWQFLEQQLRQLAFAYGYQEIRLPLLEQLGLFKRTIGEVTDIIEKEMYVFADRNGDQLALRPEGTAGCVRAAIQHGLTHNQVQRLWYLGPMFRHERPQKGRFRQFFQFGLEAFGLSEPDIDAEMILFTARLWRLLGLTDHVRLEINSLGTAEVRQRYRQALVTYLEQYQDQLDEDSQRRLHTNPLRILDSKNPAMADLIQKAPKLLDYLDENSQHHFNQLQALLDQANIRYTVNPCLVRGLDYYTNTVYEWITDSLGAQGTVCAGGRYDGLIEQLGGKPTAATGFALGLERLITLITELNTVAMPSRAAVYLISVGETASNQAMVLAERLHDALPEVQCLRHSGGGSFKSQFKKADKSGADLALVIGEEEAAKQQVAVKFLREQREQLICTFTDLLAQLPQWLRLPN